jgi:hypothetical protein
MDDRLLGEWMVDDTTPGRIHVTRRADSAYEFQFSGDGDSAARWVSVI